MTNIKTNIGAVCAELIVISGPKAAEKFASAKGRDDLSQKIQRGEFRAPRGGFGSARAMARAEALKLLAA